MISAWSSLRGIAPRGRPPATAWRPTGYDLEFGGRDAFITELFVEESVRGRGLGRRLLDATVQQLRERNVNAVHLMVRPDNARARSLYLGRGFREAPRILMTKRLVPDEE